MPRPSAARTYERITRLADAALPWEELAEEVLEVLARALPFDAATVAPFDPTTGLITGSVKRDVPADSYARFAHFEYVAPDAHAFSRLARRRRPIGVLVDDLGGDPARAERYRDFYLPDLAIGHELRIAARERSLLWAGVSLLRAAGSRGFDDDEAALADRLVAPLVRGFRGGGIRTVHAAPATRVAPLVLVVDAHNTVTAATGDRSGWFAQLDPTRTRPLPIPVVSAVVRARRRRGEPTEITVPTTGYGWVSVSAAALQATGAAEAAGDVVVTLRHADPSASSALVIAALDLTRREAQIVDRVLLGRSTAEIATALHLSPYTVQDHLKAVFAKAGVRSRRQLVALLRD